MPGLQEALLFADFVEVPHLGRWMGKSSNAAICTAQTPDQVGPRRPGVATPVPGLVLCGDGAGGHGIGMEMAALSGREAAAHVVDRRAGRS